MRVICDKKLSGECDDEFCMHQQPHSFHDYIEDAACNQFSGSCHEFDDAECIEQAVS